MQSSKKKSDRWFFGLQMREKGYRKLCTGPLKLTLTSYVPMPRSWSTAKKKRFLGKPCVVRPDLDNVIKYYCDVLNGIAYDDDAQITWIIAQKIYELKPLLEIIITRLPDNV